MPDEEFDTVVGIVEIAAYFKVHKQTVMYWRRVYKNFPKSIGEVSKNPAFWLGDIITWRTDHFAEEIPA